MVTQEGNRLTAVLDSRIMKTSCRPSVGIVCWVTALMVVSSGVLRADQEPTETPPSEPQVTERASSEPESKPADAEQNEADVEAKLAEGRERLRLALRDLGDVDPEVRRPAESVLYRAEFLLDMPAGRAMEELKRLAIEQLPLSAQQRRALRSAMVHLFVVSRHQFQGQGQGMLGLRSIQPVMIDAPGGPARGLQVPERRAGYDALTWLEEGDVILRMAPVSPNPEERVTWYAVHNFESLRSVMMGTRVGQRILLVIRRGENELTVSLRAGPAPFDRERGFGDEIYEGWLVEAERYWSQDVEPDLISRAAN